MDSHDMKLPANVHSLERARKRRMVKPRDPEPVLLDEELEEHLGQQVIARYLDDQLAIPCPFCDDGMMRMKQKKGGNPRPFGQCRDCHSQMHLNSERAEKWFMDRAIAFAYASAKGEVMG